MKVIYINPKTISGDTVYPGIPQLRDKMSAIGFSDSLISGIISSHKQGDHLLMISRLPVFFGPLIKSAAMWLTGSVFDDQDKQPNVFDGDPSRLSSRRYYRPESYEGYDTLCLRMEVVFLDTYGRRKEVRSANKLMPSFWEDQKESFAYGCWMNLMRKIWGESKMNELLTNKINKNE